MRNIKSYTERILEAVDKDAQMIKAAEEGRLKRVEKLILDGANPNATDQFGWTPLHYVADAWSPAQSEAKRRAELNHVRFLIENGADVMARTFDDRTPLHAAALAGKTDIARILVDNGSEPDPVDRNGRTPLGEAAKNYQYDTVKFLAIHGADMLNVDILKAFDSEVDFVKFFDNDVSWMPEGPLKSRLQKIARGASMFGV